MARKASGTADLDVAREAVHEAQTADALRRAQAVLLPLEFGFTLEQTSRAIGRSVAWTWRARSAFLLDDLPGKASAGIRGGRRRQNMPAEQESQILAPFLAAAAAGGRLIVSDLKAALEAALGRSIALSSVYNVLHRHGWSRRGQGAAEGYRQ